MKNLIVKELKLVLHPTSLIFLVLSAMVLIPDYPYYVVFFYTTLGIFFSCIQGRENHDVSFTVTLPIRKRDMVKARFAFVILVELVQLAVVALLSLLKLALHMPSNHVGMEANIPLLGGALVLYGVFNLIFLQGYYRHPDKIGKTFTIASIVFFLLMCVLEVAVHVVPFARDMLDTVGFLYLPQKLAMFVVCAAIYALLNLLAYRRAVVTFEKLDL